MADNKFPCEIQLQQSIPDGQFANDGPMIRRILTANARILGINHQELVKNLKAIVRQAFCMAANIQLPTFNAQHPRKRVDQ
jgi:hypothetical protein